MHRSLILVIAAAHFVTLSAEAGGFGPALQSDNLPPPAIHSQDQIRQRLAVLDRLVPGALCEPTDCHFSLRGRLLNAQ